MCDNNFRDRNGRFCATNKRKWRENIAAANYKRQKLNKKYFEGRRVIDIARLGEDMWCKACNIPLSMQFINEECLRGLASVFRIKCFKCDIIYSVKTSKQDSDDGTFHINGLLALAIYDAGIGLAEINKILTILNIPPVNQQLLKRNERRVGIAIEKVAKASCIEALKLEKAMTIQDRLNHEESTPIINDLDGGRNDDKDTNCIIDINNDKEISDDINNNNKINYNIEINNNEEINDKFKNNNKIIFDMKINYKKEVIDIEEINNNKIIINNEQINSNNSDIINNEENRKHVNPDIISFSKISEDRKNNKSEEKKPKLKQWRFLKKNIKLKESKLKSKIELFDLPKTRDTRRALETLDVNTLATNGEVGCAFGLDAGWQKSGRAHNSRTGHCTAIGRNSNLCVGYDVCTTECRLCARGVSRDQHDCRINHSGSAKSMEPAMAERILIENPDFQAEGVKTTIFIGDDDSSTIGCLRRKSNHPITKLCDKNHAITKVTSALYGLKLPTMVIDYLKYLFKCAIENNNGDVEATRKAILTIVPHSFGEHLECGAWCKYKDNPETYQHNRLPKGKPLTGEQLKASLTSLFKRQAAKAEELAPGASTQANESLNQMIARHHPKNKFYGASSSIHARIGAAISQKNIGTTYVDVVKKELSYSPSTTRAKKYRSSLDERRKNHAITSQSTVGKKRRRELFEERRKKNNVIERKEGISYQSNCGVDIGVNFIDKPMVLENKLIITEKSQLVYIDIESTGFVGSEIIQIAAKCNSDEFSAYIMPSKNIPPYITDLTGIKLYNGTLVVDSSPVLTLSPRQAANEFLSYLKNFGENIILVAHNCFTFDGPMVLQFMQEVGVIDEFSLIVKGFTDTLPVMRKHLKDRTKAKKKFKLEILAQDFLEPENIGRLHNGLTDVRILFDLIHHPLINIPDDKLFETGVTVNYLLNRKIIRDACKMKEAPLKKVILAEKDENGKLSKTEGVSTGMISKMVQAGITIEHLKETFLNSGKEGIKLLLGQNIGSQARVTTTGRIIDAIVMRLQKICNIK